jgi:hypothetical protein
MFQWLCHVCEERRREPAARAHAGPRITRRSFRGRAKRRSPSAARHGLPAGPLPPCGSGTMLACAPRRHERPRGPGDGLRCPRAGLRARARICLPVAPIEPRRRIGHPSHASVREADAAGDRRRARPPIGRRLIPAHEPADLRSRLPRAAAGYACAGRWFSPASPCDPARFRRSITSSSDTWRKSS